MAANRNLIEALVDWANTTTAVASAFPGGVWNTAAPTGTATALPYATFTQGEGRIVNVIGGNRAVQFPVVVIESRAVFAEDARYLGQALRDTLLTAPAFSWQGGSEAGRCEVEGEGGELEDGLGPDGSDVWVHRIPVQFTYGRG